MTTREESTMDTYTVVVTRTEQITFTLPATSEADAVKRYLMDGDEVASETVGTTVEQVYVDAN